MTAQRKVLYEEMPARLEIPFDVAQHFTDADIDKSFDYIFKVIYKNSNLRTDFEIRYLENSAFFSRVDFFIQYGKEKFEPVLRQILNRGNVFYPTWMNMLKFIIMDKITLSETEKVMLKKVYEKNYSSIRITFLTPR